MSKTTVLQKTFRVPLSPTKTIDLELAEPFLLGDNLALTTWTSSFILASQLHKLDNIRFQKDDNTIPILELGAGTGLVGLTAAALWQQNTVLTDLPGIVPGLRTNADLNIATVNKDVSTQTKTTVQCGTLDWTSPSTLILETGQEYHVKDTKVQMILAADTIYDEDHPQLLWDTISTWLVRNKDARVVLCYAMRIAYLDQIREIWRLFEEGGLEVEREGQEEADDKVWDDERLCEWSVWRWKQS